VAGILMAVSLNDKGYSAFNIQTPSLKELVDIAKLTAPLLLSMISKVGKNITMLHFADVFLSSYTIQKNSVQFVIRRIFDDQI